MTDSILLVDDEEAVLEAFQALLDRNGYRVECASDLSAVEARCSQGRCAVAIVDLTLTGGEPEGLSVLRYLAGLSSRPRIIVWSGRSTEDVRDQVLSAGADVFLPKPVPFKLLMERIHELLRTPQQNAAAAEVAPMRPAASITNLRPAAGAIS